MPSKRWWAVIGVLSILVGLIIGCDHTPTPIVTIQIDDVQFENYHYNDLNRHYWVLGT
jgi:hypothetical protein